MLEIIAVKLVPLTAGICLPVAVILLFLLQRTDKKNSSRLLFISAACLFAGYFLMLATVGNKEKIHVPPSGTIELRYDARPIYAANLLLSLGLIVSRLCICPVRVVRSPGKQNGGQKDECSHVTYLMK